MLSLKVGLHRESSADVLEIEELEPIWSTTSGASALFSGRHQSPKRLSAPRLDTPSIVLILTGHWQHGLTIVGGLYHDSRPHHSCLA